MRLYLHQLKAEQLVYWRSREAAVFTFIFPLLLFVLLGSVYSGRIYGVPASQALLAALLAYGCAMVAFAGLSITLVLRREAAILKRLRATPLPPPVYILSLLSSTILVFLAEVVVLFLLGRAVFGTPFPVRAGSLVLVVVLGAVCFAAMGVGLSGLIRSGEGSSAVVNLIVLPMAFLTGAFGPTRHYPQFLRAIGDALPLKYLVDLSNAVYLHHQSFWSQGTAIGVLAAWGAVGVGVALAKFRWEPREA
ncbi:MAG: ABC transporter permease [Acidobacteriota bacterium]|nr:ABC transporter permease [Acidobacteriota bacterium]MDE3189915.1 ABC transporter permease [Acidobacteriota bacterium]